MSDPNFLLYGILVMMWGTFLVGSLLTFLQSPRTNSDTTEGWTIAMGILFIVSIACTFFAWAHINHINLNGN